MVLVVRMASALAFTAVIAVAASLAAGCSGHENRIEQPAQTVSDRELVAQKLEPYAYAAGQEGSPTAGRVRSVECPKRAPDFHGYPAYLCFVTYTDGSKSIWCATVIADELYTQDNRGLDCPVFRGLIVP